MGQNGTIVAKESRQLPNVPGTAARERRGAGRRFGVLGLASVMAAGILLTARAAPRMPGAQTPQVPTPNANANGTDALEKADALVTRADGANARESRPILRDLARALADLGAAPSPEGATPTSPTALPSELRGALQEAAGRLQALLADPAFAEADADALATGRRDRRVDTAHLRTLLGQARTARAGSVALGLTYEGSYSRSRPVEPVSGGHASAMGPAPAPPPATAAMASPVRFVERVQLPTRTWAGGPMKDHILESAGNGVALIDYDGDGWLDIYLVTAAQLTPDRERVPHRNALYRNRGNWVFEDVSARAGVDMAAWGNGVCAGDADGDGRIDLYVTNWGPDFLFRNKGDGSFEEVAAAAGVAADGWSTGCTFLDADADGDLDLYVARYVETTWDDLLRAQRTRIWRNGPKVMVGPAGLPGQSDIFFENVGGGRFREATAERGLADHAKAYGFGVVATDIDDDGHVDLFVANDSNPNFLYRNTGDGHFESVGLIAGVAVNSEARAQAGMGVDAGDADGDGRMDLVLTAFAHDRNSIYRNLGDGLFEDASIASGLAAVSFERMGWGIAFTDVDLDGREDLFIANGHIFADVGDHPQLGESFAQKNQLLLNTGGTFIDVSATAGAGLQVEKVSRGLALGDLDNDGDPDAVISNMDEPPTLLENRQQTGHHWVGLQLSAPSGNRFAIGARVTVTSAAGKQVREIRSGSSYLSQNDLRVFVGLGRHGGPVAVEVRMPGGPRYHWQGLQPDRLHALELTPAALATPSRDPQ